VFNATVRADEALRFLSFRDTGWQRIPVDVRQGTMEDFDCELRGDGVWRTWAQEFALATEPARAALLNTDASGPTNPIPNLLIVNPRSALLLGKGWKLVLGTGLPSADHSLRLRESAEVAVGDITPFVVTEATASNYIRSGASIRLSLSKPVPESLTNRPADWLRLTPWPTNLTVQTEWRSLVLRGAFQGGSAYALKLLPSFESSEGFHLANSNAFTFQMPHVAPRLYFPAFARDQLAAGNRTFPLLAVNVAKARLQAKLLDPQNAIHALCGYASYFASVAERHATSEWAEPYRSLDYNLLPGQTVFDRKLALDPAPDAARKVDLAWDELLAGRRTAVACLDVERITGESDRSPALGTQAIIQLTDLGLVTKRSSSGVDVFVFSHSTGEPVAGATMRLFSGENQPLQETVIDSRGLAHLAATNNADWVAVQKGHDFHAIVLKTDRAWRYGFKRSLAGSEEQEVARRVMLFSERNLYRPGEVVHLEALVRDWGEQGLLVPIGLTGTLSCADARGRQFFQTNIALSASGAWSGPISLPGTTRGFYSVRLHLATNDYHYGFQVQDSQPNAFEVSVQAKPTFAPDEQIAVPVSAHYLFGKSLARAEVKWWLRTEDTNFRPEGFGSFRFGRTDLGYRPGHRGLSMTLNGQGTLRGGSNFVVAPKLPTNRPATQPMLGSLLVELTDLNQQTLTRNVEFQRHSSDFYLGLRQEARLLKAGQALSLEVAAVGADGQPWTEAVKAQLTLQRMDWLPVRIQGAGKTVRYRNETVVTNILRREIDVLPIAASAGLDSEPKGNLAAGLPKLPAGQYLVEVKAEDPGGREVASSLGFDVSAPAELGWNYRNDVQLTLKPDRKSYAPGETAEILLEAPFSCTACVSVERERTLRSFITRLEGNAPSIRVPLKPGDVPNVFVSVTLVRGAEACPRKIKEPEYRIGYCDLAVAAAMSRLAVTMMPGATNYLPAQAIEVTVQVADAAGAPVSGAEVVLYAVDDGILHLTDYELPDAHGFFYGPRPLGLQTSVSLPNLLPEDPAGLNFQNKGYLEGGDGTGWVRNNFLACAYWNATLTTDAHGRATARFAAPASLTRYRLFALARTANSRFGSGQSAFQVGKPLVIEPALPAFANLTDHLVARGLVQNQTALAGEVNVSLKLDARAKAIESGHPLIRPVDVPAHGSAVVEFPVELMDAGSATWIWTARFVDAAAGDFTDAVQSTLEVGHVLPMLRKVLLDHMSSPQTNLLAEEEPQLLAGQGTITVTIANARLNDLGEAVTQLLHYPYGCAEQTASSLLPDRFPRLPRLSAAAPAQHKPYRTSHRRRGRSAPLDANPIRWAGLLAEGEGPSAVGERLRRHSARAGPRRPIGTRLAREALCAAR
jgi:alpha-2-macroglobulin